jgi:predicted nucleic acid-binding protein
MIVVDSNVLSYLYLPGEYTHVAAQPLERDADWAAPVLWRSGFRNILAGYLRRKTLSFDQAYGLQREADSLLAGAEFDVDSTPVLALARDSECSACDCELIALAVQLQTKRVTMDAKLLRVFPQYAVALALAS